MTEHVLTLKHFFEEARAGRLTGIRCGKCGELAIPPKEFCPGCQEHDWTAVPLAGKGAVVSFTVIRIPPRGRGEEAPYAVAVVRLDEGVSLLGRIVDVPLDGLRTGLPVRFRPLVTGEQTAVGFGPA
ncbi:MAG TPA: Zn-ribbon domain-containing OB-fold protein [Candidatus Bathyarchaeia archaeon]|nr:Zn-ribbon domain-containing OB-fold protein [Candidatus Bathyarchaeia archaeon]